MPQEKSPTPHSKPPAPANISPMPQSTPPRIGPSLRPIPTAKKSQASGYSASNSPLPAQKHSQQSSILKEAQLPVGARLRRARDAHPASRAIHSREAHPTPISFTRRPPHRKSRNSDTAARHVQDIAPISLRFYDPNFITPQP